MVPNYDWWEAPFYGIGLKLYNLLAGKYGFGTSRILSREETLERLPTIKHGRAARRRDLLRRPVRRLAPADQPGGDGVRTGRDPAQLCAGDRLTKDADGFVDGVRFRDAETGEELRRAREAS